MTDKPKKPSKPRRVPVNSPAGIAAAIIAGGKKITVPAHVTFSPIERLIFTELCDELSKTELTPHKITLIVTLARQLAQLEQQQTLLNREGLVLTNSHGNPIANPRVSIATSLTRNILSLRRSLGIHARELAGGDNRRTAIMRDHNKRNEADRDDYDDNLIAFPSPIPEDDDDA